MCAGVLGLHRRAIMDADLDFDGILRYCIQLSGKLDLHQVNIYFSFCPLTAVIR